MAEIPRSTSWRQALERLDADRDALLAYAAHFTADPSEADRVVDEAIVAVLARFRKGRFGPNPSTVRREVRRSFGRRRDFARPAGEAPATPPPAPPELGERVRALSARVRRRRVIRATIVLVATAGLLGLGGVAVFGVVRMASGDEPGPATTAAIESTPAPTVAPTPTPTPEAEARVLGPVTVGDTLPAALPLREGMLEAAGPGWSLVQYANAEVDGELIYLVSPTGELYEVPTPLTRPHSAWGRLADWLPGSTLVLYDRGSAGGETDVVDLLTGERLLTVHGFLSGRPTADSMSIGFVGDGSTDLIVAFAENVWEPPSKVALTIRLALDGTELAKLAEFRGTDVSDTRWSPSPDGSRLALNEHGRLRVVDSSGFGEVSSLTSPYPNRPGDCAVERWAGGEKVLLACRSGTKNEYGYWSHLEAWSAPTDGGAPTKLGSVKDWETARPVGDRVVIQTYAAPGTNGGIFALHLVLEDGTLGEPVAGPEVITASAGGRLYGYDPAYDQYWNNALVAVDPVAGTVVELFGAHGERDVIAAVVTHPDR